MSKKRVKPRRFIMAFKLGVVFAYDPFVSNDAPSSCYSEEDQAI